jgi:hypothetical protein
MCGGSPKGICEQKMKDLELKPDFSRKHEPKFLDINSVAIFIPLRAGSYEVFDVAGSPWFRIEGRDMYSTSAKKLVLNTGAHHATMTRGGGAGPNVWTIEVQGGRRASIEKNSWGGASTPEYHIFIHSAPYPTKNEQVDLDLLVPTLKIQGNPRNYNYWFASFFLAPPVITCFLLVPLPLLLYTER